MKAVTQLNRWPLILSTRCLLRESQALRSFWGARDYTCTCVVRLEAPDRILMTSKTLGHGVFTSRPSSITYLKAHYWLVRVYLRDINLKTRSFGTSFPAFKQQLSQLKPQMCRWFSFVSVQVYVGLCPTTSYPAVTLDIPFCSTMCWFMPHIP